MRALWLLALVAIAAAIEVIVVRWLEREARKSAEMGASDD